MAKKQLTGLWYKESKNESGEGFLGGVLTKEKLDELRELIKGQEKVYINIFPNGYKKEGDNKPDWVFYVSTPEGETAPAPKPAVNTKAKMAMAARGKPKTQESYEEEPTEDDIVF